MRPSFQCPAFLRRAVFLLAAMIIVVRPVAAGDQDDEGLLPERFEFEPVFGSQVYLREANTLTSTVYRRNPDDPLFLFFTDGLSEAMNSQAELFGEARLREIIEQSEELGSEELKEKILRDIHAFVGDAAQHDDMTMVILKVA